MAWLDLTYPPPPPIPRNNKKRKGSPRQIDFHAQYIRTKPRQYVEFYGYICHFLTLKNKQSISSLFIIHFPVSFVMWHFTLKWIHTEFTDQYRSLSTDDSLDSATYCSLHAKVEVNWMSQLWHLCSWQCLANNVVHARVCLGKYFNILILISSKQEHF